MRPIPAWLWRRRWRTLGALLFLGFAALNASAYLHARAMTHFVPGGARTPPPESLAFLEKLKILATGVRLPKPLNGTTPAALGLDFTTHTIETADGLALEVWRIPAPAARGTVLLFHGYAVSKASVLPQAQAFHALGFDTLLVDFRGSGGSAGHATTLGHDEVLDVAAAVRLAESLPAVEPVILYAYSMGTAAVLRAGATAGVRPAALILEGPFSTMLQAVENRFALMELPAFPAAHLLVFWGGVQHGFNAFAHSALDYARSVRCPVLVLRGELDSRSTAGEAAALRAALAGPAELVAIPGAGHDSVATERPDEWRGAVAHFLAPLTRAGTSAPAPPRGPER
ncbi:MAG: alpha/beta fold hydrolase [Planctomycetes bacterium]|nr:alpha/beta fold hydrolase [Planctomycetota bacterium]